MAKNIHSDWIKHLRTDKDRKDFELTLRNSSFILDVLKSLVDQKLAGIERSERSRESYENPSWAYRQAHQNGEINGLTYIQELLSFLNPRP